MISIIGTYYNHVLIDIKTSFIGVFMFCHFVQLPLLITQIILIFLLIFGIIENKTIALKYSLIVTALIVLITLFDLFWM